MPLRKRRRRVIKIGLATAPHWPPFSKGVDATKIPLHKKICLEIKIRVDL